MLVNVASLLPGWLAQCSHLFLGIIQCGNMQNLHNIKQKNRRECMPCYHFGHYVGSPHIFTVWPTNGTEHPSCESPPWVLSLHRLTGTRSNQNTQIFTANRHKMTQKQNTMQRKKLRNIIIRFRCWSCASGRFATPISSSRYSHPIPATVWRCAQETRTLWSVEPRRDLSRKWQITTYTVAQHM